ncbi:hypothetical protein ACDI10_16540 [Vreelandella venusta]|uniref:hypothetical protein n=1 Tax=Vreelandella venusta TaxID=44935 RepID=UPI003555FBCF
MNDHDYVNFSEDYELNYVLRKMDKRQTQENRERLNELGQRQKRSTGKPRLQHGEFHQYVRQNLWQLE